MQQVLQRKERRLRGRLHQPVEGYNAISEQLRVHDSPARKIIQKETFKVPTQLKDLILSQVSRTLMIWACFAARGL